MRTSTMTRSQRRTYHATVRGMKRMVKTKSLSWGSPAGSGTGGFTLVKSSGQQLVKSMVFPAGLKINGVTFGKKESSIWSRRLLFAKTIWRICLLELIPLAKSLSAWLLHLIDSDSLLQPGQFVPVTFIYPLAIQALQWVDTPLFVINQKVGRCSTSISLEKQFTSQQKPVILGWFPTKSTNKWMDGWMDWWMHGWMDGCLDG